MIGFFIALLSGALMSIQGVFNTEVTKQSSVWTSASFVQITAFITCFLAWLFTERGSFFAPLTVKPKYMLLGGVIGAFITMTVIISMNQMGPGKAAMLIVISQLITAYGIELLGIFGADKSPLSMKKVIGMGIMIVGVILFQGK